MSRRVGVQVFFGPESGLRTGVLNFLTPQSESESHRNENSASLVCAVFSFQDSPNDISLLTLLLLWFYERHSFILKALRPILIPYSAMLPVLRTLRRNKNLQQPITTE